MPEILKADIVVIGSGAGGATVAKELSRVSKKKIVLLEKGSSPKRVGSELFASQVYDKCALFSKSKEGVVIYRAITLGGTTLVSCGNGVRSLENELEKLGIDLEDEYEEAEKELNIIPNPIISKTSRAIIKASNNIGINMVPTPKFFTPKNCTLCGRCVLGCRSMSKWSSLNDIEEAKKNGVKVVTNSDIQKILSYKGRVIGARGKRRGRGLIVKAKLIIVCAGGLGTPVILQNSGLEAGKRLFCDLLNVTYGISKEYSLLKEPTMSVVSDMNFFKEHGFILSPFIDSFLVLLSLVPLGQDLKKKRLNWLLKRLREEDGSSIDKLDIGYPAKSFRRRKVVGIMTKIKDNNVGSVDKKGIISKTVTEQDLQRLKKGALLAKKILSGIGVDPKTMVVTKTRGAHPGGTAAIGDIVDTNLETKIKGLYVSDASVFPESAGLPPILTIVALSKRLSKILINKELV